MLEKKKLSGLFINVFGLGDFGFQLMVNMELIFWMVFMTDAIRFSADQITFITTVTGIFDVAWVFVAGLIVQRCNFKFGKLRSWLLYAPPFIWATFIFQFWSFSGNGGLAQWLVIFGFVASHLIWNCSYTAHIAMISAYTDDVQERTVLSSRRMLGQALGKILFSSIAVGVIVKFSGLFGEVDAIGRNAQGYGMAAIVLPLVMVACYFIVFFVSKGYESTSNDKKAPAVAQEQKLSVWESIKLAVTNSQLVVLAIADFGRCFAFYLITSMNAYYFRVVLDAPGMLATYLVWINISATIASLITPYVSKLLGKKNTYFFGMIGYVIGLFVVYFFSEGNPTLFMVTMIIATGVVQLAFSVGTAMFADTVVYSEWKHGVSNRGFVMSLYSFPIKTGVLVRATFMSLMLKAMSYNPDSITPTMVTGIKNLFTIYPAVVIAVCTAFFFLFYKLTDKKVAELSKEIADRK